MEDLLRRFQSVPRSGPYRPDPDVRSRRVEQCEALLRQPEEVRRAVHEVSRGDSPQALSYESSVEGALLYLWEHAPPQGYTVKALLLPALKRAGAPAPRRRPWRSLLILTLCWLTLTASLVLAAYSYGVSTAIPAVGTMPDRNWQTELAGAVRAAIREERAARPAASAFPLAEGALDKIEAKSVIQFEPRKGLRVLVIVLPNQGTKSPSNSKEKSK